jgi:hypothetical protein
VKDVEEKISATLVCDVGEGIGVGRGVRGRLARWILSRAASALVGTSVASKCGERGELRQRSFHGPRYGMEYVGTTGRRDGLGAGGQYLQPGTDNSTPRLRKKETCGTRLDWGPTLPKLSNVSRDGACLTGAGQFPISVASSTRRCNTA